MISLSLEEIIANNTQVGLYIAGIVLYSFFIFRFYRFIARRDIFPLNLKEYTYEKHPIMKHTIKLINYVLEHLIVLPILVFFWFITLSTFIFLMSKQQDIGIVLTVSMAVVGAIRVTAYYDEELSRDLAKMLPFALLGVFIIDINYISISEVKGLINNISLFSDTILSYLILIVAIELVLRIIHGLFSKEEQKSG